MTDRRESMMQPLTPTVWEKHFAELRPYVVEEFPDVPENEIEGVRGDWNWLVELIQRHEGLSAQLVHQRLRKLDVEELGLGTGDGETQAEEGRASLDQLRLGAGFTESERDRIVSLLGKLNRRLRKFQADGTELELSVKDRDSTSQKVTLECWLPKFPHLAATSNEHELKAALMDVREDMWRQIDDAVNRRKEGQH